MEQNWVPWNKTTQYSQLIFDQGAKKTNGGRMGFPLVAQTVKTLPAIQCRRPRFDPWVGKIPWRREWPPVPVFLPGEFHEQCSLAGCSPRGLKELDTTEWLRTIFPKDKWRKDSLVSKCLRKTGQPPAEEWNWTPVLHHSQKSTQNGLKT